MKPFNIEKAKAGNPVLFHQQGKTYPARIICFDRKGQKDKTIIALVTDDTGKEETLYFDEKGESVDGYIRKLVMAPQRREGWVNIFSHPNFPDDRFTLSTVFKSESAALAALNDSQRNNLLTTTRIEWEE